MFGFGHSEARWYCAQHRAIGKELWDSVRGKSGVERGRPGAGMF